MCSSQQTVFTSDSSLFGSQAQRSKKSYKQICRRLPVETHLISVSGLQIQLEKT